MTESAPIDVAEEVAKVEEQRAHRTAVWVLVTLGTIVMVMSTLNVWVERQ